MKYLKKFENNKEIIYHKNDIIISEWSKTDEVYLVLNDFYYTDEKISCIYIGCISKYSEPYYSIFFNKDVVKIEDKKNDIINSFHIINDLELEMMTKLIFSDDTKVNYYIDIIKDITNINLKELKILTDSEIRRNANKFNL